MMQARQKVAAGFNQPHPSTARQEITAMIRGLHEPQKFSEQVEQPPFDTGFESGLSGGTLFDCPYGHATEEALRQRHEWLEGYLTALANSKAADLF